MKTQKLFENMFTKWKNISRVLFAVLLNENYRVKDEFLVGW